MTAIGHQPARGLLGSVLSLSGPMILSQLFYAAYSLVDIFFLGLVGPEALAAASLGGAVEALTWVLLTAVDVACRSFVARHLGEGGADRARRFAGQTLLLCAVLSLVVAVLGYLFAPRFLFLLGGRGEVLEMATSYLRILAVGSFTLFYIQIGKAILEAAGDAKTPMRVMFVSAAGNIALDPILIFGFWFVPSLGVAGAALATIAARLIGIAILLRAISSTGSALKLGLADLRFHRPSMLSLVALAIPRSIQRALEVMSMLALMRLVAFYGTYGLAAHGIGLRIDLAMRTPGYGFSNAAVTLVGQSLGSGDGERAGRTAWIVAACYMAVASVAGIAFLAWPGEIMELFTDHPRVLELGSSYLRIMAVAFVFLAMGMIFERSLGGVGDTVSPMVISALALLLFQVGAAYAIAQFIGVRGVWWANALAYGLWGVSLASRFHGGRWKPSRFGAESKP